MDDKTVTDALLREFLLGNVSDEERQRIESLFLTDPQARERVLGVEQDLIEDYLEGTLIAADRERFVSRYAQTAEQRRKLRITKSIKDWAITESAATQAVPATVSHGRSWLRQPSFVIPLVVTALIVIVIAAIWLSRRTAHSGIEQELAQLNAPSNQQAFPVSLELSPVTVRGGESQNLNPRSQGGVLVLRLLLIEKERYSSYHATIHRVGDSQSFNAGDLQPENDGKAIRIKLPSHMLTRGTYQIILTGLAPDGSPGPTEEYTFNIDGL